MSTDSTLSTTSLKDKRLFEYTDEELWTLLESRPREIRKVPDSPNPCANTIESKSWFSYALTNGVFYILLRGGNEEESQPPDLELPLKDYKWFMIELWDYRELDEEMKKAADIPDQTYKMADGTNFLIKFEVRVWPHLAINPHTDERFKDQPWSCYFRQSTMGHHAPVSPAVFAEIVRYCDKISNFKAFW